MNRKGLVHKMKLLISKLLCCGDCNAGNMYNNCKIKAAKRIAQAIVKEFSKEVQYKNNKSQLHGEPTNNIRNLIFRTDLKSKNNKLKESFSYEILEVKDNYLKVRHWHIVYSIGDIPIKQKDHAKIFEVRLDKPISERIKYLEDNND